MILSAINRNPDVAWPDDSPHPWSFSLTLSLAPPPPRQRHLSTPWHRTPNVGDADVNRHRYLTVTHTVHHYTPTTTTTATLSSLHNTPPPAPPSSPLTALHFTSVSVFLSPSSLLASLQEKLGGHLRQRMKKWKLRVWKRQHTSSSLFEAAWSRRQGREKEVEIHIVLYLNFKRDRGSMNSGWKQFSALNKHWGVNICKQCWRNIRGASATTTTPMLGGECKLQL